MADAASIVSQVALGAATRPRSRPDPSRRQARQHPGHAGRPRQAVRLGLGRPVAGRRGNRPAIRHGSSARPTISRPTTSNARGVPTPAWDIYSLGCTLYYTVTGKVPFPGGSTADKVQGHLRLRPLDPRRLNPRLGDQFVDVVAQMMAKNPAERIGSATEVVQRLAPWIQPAGRTALHGQSEYFGSAALAVPPGVSRGDCAAEPGDRCVGLRGHRSGVSRTAGVRPGAQRQRKPGASGHTADRLRQRGDLPDAGPLRPGSPPRSANSCAPFTLLVLLPSILVGIIYLIGWLLRAW